MYVHRGKNMWEHWEEEAGHLKTKEIVLRRHWTYWHLDLGLLASRTMKEINYYRRVTQTVAFCYDSPSKLIQDYSLLVYFWDLGQEKTWVNWMSFCFSNESSWIQFSSSQRKVHKLLCQMYLHSYSHHSIILIRVWFCFFTSPRLNFLINKVTLIILFLNVDVKIKWYTVGFLYPQVPHLQMQPILNHKYLGKKSKVFQKAKLQFAACQQLIT